MKVKWIPFKFIHSDPVSNLNNAGEAQPKLTLKYDIYPLINVFELPIRVRITYRVHKLPQDNAIFSIVGEGEAHLEFTKGEDPTEDIRRLLANFQLQVEVHWEDKTRYTSIFGQTIKSIDKSVEEKFIKDIIEIANKHSLL